MVTSFYSIIGGMCPLRLVLCDQSWREQLSYQTDTQPVWCIRMSYGTLIKHLLASKLRFPVWTLISVSLKSMKVELFVCDKFNDFQEVNYILKEAINPQILSLALSVVSYFCWSSSMITGSGFATVMLKCFYYANVTLRKRSLCILIEHL